LLRERVLVAFSCIFEPQHIASENSSTTMNRPSAPEEEPATFTTITMPHQPAVKSSCCRRFWIRTLIVALVLLVGLVIITFYKAESFPQKDWFSSAIYLDHLKRDPIDITDISEDDPYKAIRLIFDAKRLHREVYYRNHRFNVQPSGPKFRATTPSTMVLSRKDELEVAEFIRDIEPFFANDKTHLF
jgi:hypothetical protein